MKKKSKNYIEITTAQAVGETFSFETINPKNIWIDDEKIELK